MIEHNFRGYDRRCPFYPFGYFLLYRTCQKIRRYEGYRRMRSLNTDQAERRPEEVADKDEECVRLWKAIGELPEEDQIAIIRKHINGEKAAVIASDFGTNARNFNCRTHKLRNQLRKLLENDGK